MSASAIILCHFWLETVLSTRGWPLIDGEMKCVPKGWVFLCMLAFLDWSNGWQDIAAGTGLCFPWKSEEAVIWWWTVLRKFHTSWVRMISRIRHSSVLTPESETTPEWQRSLGGFLRWYVMVSRPISQVPFGYGFYLFFKLFYNWKYIVLI
jgi:hypothetical protein